MKSLDLIREEMGIYGYSRLGPVLSADEVRWFREDISRRKQAEVEEFGADYLRSAGEYDIIRGLIRFVPEYLALVEAAWINACVDELLDPNAIIHDYFALFNTQSDSPELTRNRFHRDLPPVGGHRMSVTFLVPLIDMTRANGATQIVPATHRQQETPSPEFLAAHGEPLELEAGSGVVMDAGLLHRAGGNTSGSDRPLLLLRYQLAFLQRPLNLCRYYEKELATASPLVKLRLGWHCRGMGRPEESRDEDPGWKSGQYNMRGTRL